MNGRNELGSGMNHPMYDMNTLGANMDARKAKAQSQEAEGEAQEPSERSIERSIIKSPRSSVGAQYSMHVFARERMQWLTPKW